MPQATDELRKEWNGPDDSTAREYLTSRGFTLTAAWEWIPSQPVTDKDMRAIDFMVEEWDFGGIQEGTWL